MELEARDIILAIIALELLVLLIFILKIKHSFKVWPKPWQVPRGEWKIRLSKNMGGHVTFKTGLEDEKKATLGHYLYNWSCLETAKFLLDASKTDKNRTADPDVVFTPE